MRLQPLLLGVALAGLTWAGGAAQVAPPAGQARDTQAASPATGTGLVSGRITLAGTGQPVEGVRVTINGAELRGSRSVMTDDEGGFAFAELPAGTFTVRATRTGYVAGTYGQKAPGRPGTAIVLAAGQQLKDVSFEIAKGGVISGLVVDEKNRPSIGTPVRVLRWLAQSGERTLVSAGSATTDDRGIYRVYNLVPGDYLVSAVPRNTDAEVMTTADVQRAEELRALGLMGTPATVTLSATLPGGGEPAMGHAPVFYPGTPDVSAARSVRVGIAEEQLGIDFSLQRVRLTTVTGHVAVPSGQSPTTVQVRLLQPDGNALGLGQMSVRPSQTGTFTFRTVVPGQYIVFATATVAPQRGTEVPAVPQPPGMPPGQPASQRRLWAQADVFVDGGHPPVVSLTMQEGLTVSGYLAFDGSAPQPQGPMLQRIRVTLNPLGQPLQSAGLGSVVTEVDSAGRFTLYGLIPGRYRAGASGAAGWQVKSVMVNGVDVLDFPFVIEAGTAVPELAIRFGDRHTELRGRLMDAGGMPTAEYAVVIFPDDPRYWVPFARRMRSARPDTAGVFSFSGLPPGEYRLAAVTDVEAGEWLDPEFLRQLVPASISVRLVDGQPTVQDIRVR